MNCSQDEVKTWSVANMFDKSALFQRYSRFLPLPFSRGQGAHTPCFPSNSMKGERERERGREGKRQNLTLAVSNNQAFDKLS